MYRSPPVVEMNILYCDYEYIMMKYYSEYYMRTSIYFILHLYRYQVLLHMEFQDETL